MPSHQSTKFDWKKFFFQKRNKLLTLAEIWIPIIPFLLFAWIRTENQPYLQPDPIKYQPLSIDNKLWLSEDSMERTLLFSPNNAIFKSLMDEVILDLKFDGVYGVDADDILNVSLSRKSVAAIVFHHSDAITKLPKKLSYSLRFPVNECATYYYDLEKSYCHTEQLIPLNTFDKSLKLWKEKYDYNQHYEGEFSTIQNSIAKQFIKMINSSVQMPEIQLQRFPLPPSPSEEFLDSLQWVAPLIFLISFLFPFISIVRSISSEKQSNQAMDLQIWFSLLARSMIMLILSMVGIVILLKSLWFEDTIPIYTNSNIACLFIFFICYFVCITTYGSLISALFPTVKTAIFASFFAWNLSIIPFYLTQLQFNVLPDWIKILSCICPNTSLGYGLMFITRLEIAGRGLIWSAFFKPATVYDTLSVAIICAIMLCCSMMFLGVAMYLRKKIRSTNGITQTRTDETQNPAPEQVPLTSILDEPHSDGPQFKDVIKYRFFYWLRSWNSVILYNLFILILLIAIAFDLRNFVERREEVSASFPPFDVTLDAYRSPIAFVQNTENSNNSEFAEKILHQFKESIQTNSNAELSTLSAINNDLIAFGNSSQQVYRTQYLIGASADINDTIFAWYNNQAYHSADISLNAIHDAIVKANFGHDFGIQVKNEPLFDQQMQIISKNSKDDDVYFGVLFSLFIGVSLSIYLASYLSFYIKERKYVNSVNNTIMFWFTSLIWDILTISLTFFMIFIVLAIAQHIGYSSFADLAQISGLLFIHTMAMLPVLYLISLAFSTPSLPIILITIGNLLIVGFFWYDFSLGFYPSFIRYIFLVYPIHSLMDCFTLFTKYKWYLAEHPHFDENILFTWGEEAIQKNLVYMIGTTIISFVILIILEKRLIQKMTNRNSFQVDINTAIRKQRMEYIPKYGLITDRNK